MRRSGGLVRCGAVALVSLAVGLSPVAGSAAPVTGDPGADRTGASTAEGSAVGLLLATEGGEAELPGPSPEGPDATGNPAAPEPYEPNFLWGATIGLLGLTVLGLLGLGALYFLLVVLPRRFRDQAD